MAETPTNGKQSLISKGSPVTISILVIMVTLAFACGVLWAQVAAAQKTLDAVPRTYATTEKLDLTVTRIDGRLARIEKDIAGIQAAVKE